MMQTQRGAPEMPMQEMEGPENKTCIYGVVRFIDKPYLDIAKYVCVPYSWVIYVQCSKGIVRVAYPSGEPGERTSERVLRGQRPRKQWNIYWAVVAYMTGSHRFAQAFIWHLSRQDIFSDSFNGAAVDDDKYWIEQKIKSHAPVNNDTADMGVAYDAVKYWIEQRIKSHAPVNNDTVDMGVAYDAQKYWIEQKIKSHAPVNKDTADMGVAVDDKKYRIEQKIKSHAPVIKDTADMGGNRPTAAPDNSSGYSGGSSLNLPLSDLKKCELALADCKPLPELLVKQICKRPATSAMVDSKKRPKRVAVDNVSRMADPKSKKSKSKQSK